MKTPKDDFIYRIEPKESPWFEFNAVPTNEDESLLAIKRVESIREESKSREESV